MFWIGLVILNLIGVGILLYLWRVVAKIGPGTYSGMIAAGAVLYAGAILLVMLFGSILALSIYLWPDFFAPLWDYTNFINVSLAIIIALLIILVKRR